MRVSKAKEQLIYRFFSKIIVNCLHGISIHRADILTSAIVYSQSSDLFTDVVDYLVSYVLADDHLGGVEG